MSNIPREIELKPSRELKEILTDEALEAIEEGLRE